MSLYRFLKFDLFLSSFSLRLKGVLLCLAHQKFCISILCVIVAWKLFKIFKAVSRIQLFVFKTGILWINFLLIESLFWSEITATSTLTPLSFQIFLVLSSTVMILGSSWLCFCLYCLSCFFFLIWQFLSSTVQNCSCLCSL